MNINVIIARRRVVTVIILVVSLVIAFMIEGSSSRAADNQPSDAAQKALEYIAKRDGIPVEVLKITEDHPTEYPSLGRKLQAGD